MRVRPNRALRRRPVAYGNQFDEELKKEDKANEVYYENLGDYETTYLSILVVIRDLCSSVVVEMVTKAVRIWP